MVLPLIGVEMARGFERRMVRADLIRGCVDAGPIPHPKAGQPVPAQDPQHKASDVYPATLSTVRLLLEGGQELIVIGNAQGVDMALRAQIKWVQGAQVRVAMQIQQEMAARGGGIALPMPSRMNGL